MFSLLFDKEIYWLFFIYRMMHCINIVLENNPGDTTQMDLFLKEVFIYLFFVMRQMPVKRANLNFLIITN